MEILQLIKPVPIETTGGPAMAIILILYGANQPVKWVAVLCTTGQLRQFTGEEVTLVLF